MLTGKRQKVELIELIQSLRLSLLYLNKASFNICLLHKRHIHKVVYCVRNIAGPNRPRIPCVSNSKIAERQILTLAMNCKLVVGLLPLLRTS